MEKVITVDKNNQQSLLSDAILTNLKHDDVKIHKIKPIKQNISKKRILKENDKTNFRKEQK